MFMMQDRLVSLSEQQITRYLELVDRRTYILLHSGVDWKPEYKQEMQEIDKEIAPLRRAIDAARASRALVSGTQTQKK